MSKKWLLKTLNSLGFSKEEANIYFLLSRGGPKKAKDIAFESKISIRKVYRILKKLQETKIIEAKTTRTIEFQVIPFDNFLDLLVKNCLKEVNLLEEKKPEILANWKSTFGRIDFDIVRDPELGNL